MICNYERNLTIFSRIIDVAEAPIDEGKWWTAEFLSDLAESLTDAAIKLKKVCEQMQSEGMPQLRITAETAFTGHAASVIGAVDKAETALKNQLRSKRHGTKTDWERNRRTVLQRNAKRKAVVATESLGLVATGLGDSLTLRQLTAILQLSQKKKSRDDIAILLEEIREAGIESDTVDQLAADNRASLEAQVLIKKSAKKVAAKPVKKRSGYITGKPDRGEPNRGKPV